MQLLAGLSQLKFQTCVPWSSAAYTFYFSIKHVEVAVCQEDATDMGRRDGYIYLPFADLSFLHTVHPASPQDIDGIVASFLVGIQ